MEHCRDMWSSCQNLLSRAMTFCFTSRFLASPFAGHSKGGEEAKHTVKQNLARMAPSEPFLETIPKLFLRWSREGNAGHFWGTERYVPRWGGRTQFCPPPLFCPPLWRSLVLIMANNETAAARTLLRRSGVMHNQAAWTETTRILPSWPRLRCYVGVTAWGVSTVFQRNTLRCAAAGLKTREGCGCRKVLAGKVFRQFFDAAGKCFPDFPAAEMLSPPRFGHFPARRMATGKSAPPSGTLLDFLL